MKGCEKMKKHKKGIFIAILIIGIIFGLIDLYLVISNIMIISNLYFPLTGVFGTLVLILFLIDICFLIICAKNFYKGKNYKKTLKITVILIISSLLLYFVVGSINKFIQTNYIFYNKKKLNNIITDISNNYNNFNISVDDFVYKIGYELCKDNLKIVNKEYTNDYDFNYNYIIELSNGDYILLSTSDGGFTINKILYNFTKNKDAKSAGYFISVMSRLFINNLDKEDYYNTVVNEFLSNDTIWGKEYSCYVYKHILYSLNIKFDDNDGIEDIYMQYIPVTEDNNEEYEEMIKRKMDELFAETERKNAEEQEQRAREGEEEKALLQQKERVFSAGNYVVGTDIEPGTYNMIAISGSGNCFVHSKTYVNEIFDVGGGQYAIDRYNNVILSSGGTIEVTSTLKIKFEPIG